MTDEGFDHGKARLRGKFEAAMLDLVVVPAVHAAHGDRKQEVIGAMTGTVVELGPGTGANMRYYGPDVHVIAIEPNPAMHDRLLDAARRHGVDLELRTVKGERMQVEDDTADAVVCTLVLCAVDHPERVLQEVRRVLQPGGTFFFLEHVRAPEGTVEHTVQRIMRRPHRWMFNGCVVTRDTGALIRDTFDEVQIDEWVGPVRTGLYTRHQIVGTARA